MNIIQELQRSRVFGLTIAAVFLTHTLCPTLALALSADGQNIDLGAPSAKAEKRFVDSQNKLLRNSISTSVSALYLEATRIHDAVEAERDQALIGVMLTVVGEINKLTTQFSGNSPLSSVGSNFVSQKAVPAILAATQSYQTSAVSFPGLESFNQMVGLSGAFGEAAQFLGQGLKTDLLTLPTGNIDPSSTLTQLNGFVSKYQGMLTSSNDQLATTATEIASTESQIRNVTTSVTNTQATIASLTQDLATQQSTLASLQTALATAQAAVPPDDALIVSIQTQIDGVNTTINGLNLSISGFNTELSSLTSQLSGLQSNLSGLQNLADTLTSVNVPFATGAIGQFQGMIGIINTAQGLAGWSGTLSGFLGGINTDISILNGIGGNLTWAFDRFTNYFDGAQRYINGIQDQVLKLQSSKIYDLAKKFGPILLKILKDPSVLGSLVTGFVRGIAGAIVGVIRDAIAGLIPGFIRGLIPGLAVAAASFEPAAATSVGNSVTVCKGSKYSLKRIKCEKKRAAKWKKFKAGYTRFRRDAILQTPQLLAEASRDEVTGETLAQSLARIDAEFRSKGLGLP